MVVLKSLGFAAALAFVAGAAQAHVSVDPGEARAGAYQVLRFGGGHGCDGAATTALRIEVPASIETARPQPKPGWTLTIEHAGERVSAVVWRGRLPADQYDEFLIQVKLPDAAGPLPFPAIQSCGKAEVRWVEPAPVDAPRPSHPAPVVHVIPATEGSGGHHH